MSADHDDAVQRLRVMRRSSSISPRQAIENAVAALRKPRSISSQRAIADAFAAMQSEITANANTTDSNFQVITDRLDAMEREINRLYWYILTPVLILAVIVGSLLVQKIYDIVVR